MGAGRRHAPRSQHNALPIPTACLLSVLQHIVTHYNTMQQQKHRDTTMLYLFLLPVQLCCCATCVRCRHCNPIMACAQCFTSPSHNCHKVTSFLSVFYFFVSCFFLLRALAVVCFFVSHVKFTVFFGYFTWNSIVRH